MSLYYHSDVIHNVETPREVVPLIQRTLRPKSVLDVGCGLGTWLRAFSELEVEDYLGLDGDHVDTKRLKIPLSKFRVQNLIEQWDLGRKYDLVLCLEVAEHLPEQVSDRFVEVLVKHGDNIIFSAAIPGQGGQNHLNEQWTAYWQEKFGACGYYFHDVIRPLIWNNANIEWWYKQNMFLVSREPSTVKILDVIHPDLFHERTRLIDDTYAGRIGIKTSLSLFMKSAIKWIGKA